MLSEASSGLQITEGALENDNSSAEKHTSTKGEGRSMISLGPVQIGIVLVLFASFQVVAYTAFRLADFRGFSLDAIAPLLSDWRFWLGVVCSFGVLVLSFTLVQTSGTSIQLVILLYINSVLVSFLMLPLAWKYVFGEEIFRSSDRVVAFCLALVSALGLLVATYFWNRG